MHFSQTFQMNSTLRKLFHQLLIIVYVKKKQREKNGIPNALCLWEGNRYVEYKHKVCSNVKWAAQSIRSTAFASVLLPIEIYKQKM